MEGAVLILKLYLTMGLYLDYFWISSVSHPSLIGPIPNFELEQTFVTLYGGRSQPAGWMGRR